MGEKCLKTKYDLNVNTTSCLFWCAQHPRIVDMNARYGLSQTFKHISSNCSSMSQIYWKMKCSTQNRVLSSQTWFLQPKQHAQLLHTYRASYRASNKHRCDKFKTLPIWNLHFLYVSASYGNVTYSNSIQMCGNKFYFSRFGEVFVPSSYLQYYMHIACCLFIIVCDFTYRYYTMTNTAKKISAQKEKVTKEIFVHYHHSKCWAELFTLCCCVVCLSTWVCTGATWGRLTG